MVPSSPTLPQFSTCISAVCISAARCSSWGIPSKFGLRTWNLEIFGDTLRIIFADIWTKITQNYQTLERIQLPDHYQIIKEIFGYSGTFLIYLQISANWHSKWFSSSVPFAVPFNSGHKNILHGSQQACKRHVQWFQVSSHLTHREAQKNIAAIPMVNEYGPRWCRKSHIKIKAHGGFLNRATSRSSIFMEFPEINQRFWGTPHGHGNHHMRLMPFRHPRPVGTPDSWWLALALSGMKWWFPES